MPEYILGSDIDCTLYPTKENIIFAINHSLKSLGVQTRPEEEILSVYQAKDWKQLYRSLGVAEDKIDSAIQTYLAFYAGLIVPPPIEGAREFIRAADNIFGANFFLITNESFEAVETRFNRDELVDFLPNVHSSFQGKYDLIRNILDKKIKANSNDIGENVDVNMIYLSDTVSDGEDCLRLVSEGYNIVFWAIMHEHSLSLKEKMKGFIASSNHDAKGFESLYDVIVELETNGFRKK